MKFNWYKRAQYTAANLRDTLITYIQQSERGIIEPSMAIEDIEASMGESVDPSSIMISLNEASVMIAQYQGGSLTPSQDVFISSFRSYVDSENVGVGTAESIAEPESIDSI